MVLGLSLPTTAVYILLAVLVGPALTQAGIVPIAAHLFIFYFGMLSTITPPVCLAAYTAASLAKADPMKTGWESMRLAILAYIVPFIFALSPTLLLIGHWSEVTLSIITALIGAILLGVGLVGYLFRPVGIVRRILFVVADVGLLAPVVNNRPICCIDLGQQRCRCSVGGDPVLFRVAETFVSRPCAADRRSGQLTCRLPKAQRLTLARIQTY